MLSPANLGGERAAMLLRPAAAFPLARRLRAGGAPLGEVFSFLSGLYFRGKLTYARAFGVTPPGLPAPALVITPAEGLRFPEEMVTADRLRAWAEVDIDAGNPRFVRPLVEHAEALGRALVDEARFVLLGSIATGKYIEPLARALGDRLLFPPAFVGRGDMSRGALLLRAVEAGRELPYCPVAGAVRHGPRAPSAARARATRPADLPPPANGKPEVVLLVGLPGAGKSTFFRQRFQATHVQVSKDLFPSARRPADRQARLVDEALDAGRNVVVDNTNASRNERAPPLAQARAHGARVIGYVFAASVDECRGRNAGRTGRARVPDVAIFAAAKRLSQPVREEGFDELYVVRTLPGGGFEIRPTE